MAIISAQSELNSKFDQAINCVSLEYNNKKKRTAKSECKSLVKQKRKLLEKKKENFKALKELHELTTSSWELLVNELDPVLLQDPMLSKLIKTYSRWDKFAAYTEERLTRQERTTWTQHVHDTFLIKTNAALQPPRVGVSNEEPLKIKKKVKEDNTDIVVQVVPKVAIFDLEGSETSSPENTVPSLPSVPKQPTALEVTETKESLPTPRAAERKLEIQQRINAFATAIDTQRIELKTKCYSQQTTHSVNAIFLNAGEEAPAAVDNRQRLSHVKPLAPVNLKNKDDSDLDLAIDQPDSFSKDKEKIGKNSSSDSSTDEIEKPAEKKISAKQEISSAPIKNRFLEFFNGKNNFGNSGLNKLIKKDASKHQPTIHGEKVETASSVSTQKKEASVNQLDTFFGSLWKQFKTYLKPNQTELIKLQKQLNQIEAEQETASTSHRGLKVK